VRCERFAVPKYSGVRIALVKGFPNYLIFYFPSENGVAIERVIHAKQDYNRVLR
jgi:toxin ParE1/3/4